VTSTIGDHFYPHLDEIPIVSQGTIL